MVRSALSTKSVRSAAVATLIALAILIALGVWQLHRLHWKENILAQIDHAQSSPPVPLGAKPAPFSKVTATGILLPGTVLYGAQVHDQPNGQSRMGAQRLQIMLRGGQPALLVDLGWVPDGTKSPYPSTQPVTIMGYIRAPDHAGALSAEDDPASRHFYTLDPAVIGKAMGVHTVAPYTLVAMGALAGPNDPQPATELPRPQNNHLQYAFTWFGLAFALVAVFIAWVRSQPRPNAAPASNAVQHPVQAAAPAAIPAPPGPAAIPMPAPAPPLAAKAAATAAQNTAVVPVPPPTPAAIPVTALARIAPSLAPGSEPEPELDPLVPPATTPAPVPGLLQRWLRLWRRI